MGGVGKNWAVLRKILESEASLSRQRAGGRASGRIRRDDAAKTDADSQERLPLLRPPAPR
jgi:hypothetical protein